MPTRATSILVVFLVASWANEGRAADIEVVLDRHIAAIQQRDLAAYAATLTADEDLSLVLPNGQFMPTRAEVLDMHREWFKDPDWRWEGELVRTIVGADMATVLVKFHYRNTPADDARSFWMTLVFRLDDGEWRVVHDHASPISPP